MISESTPKTNTAEKNTRYAIVGGGIAGLATAYQLQKKLASESQYGHPVTIDVFEKGSAESYHAGESAKRASLGESPARTMRMSGGAFNVRATKAMIDDLQQFLDTATENGQLAALGLEAFKGRQLFQPVENIYIGKADELTNESSKYATNKAAFAKTNTLIEEISGLELKQRYRGTQNATGDTPRSIYENIADDAAVLIEKAYDPVSNPEGVSGVMDYEAILNVLVAKLRNHPTVPALIHFGHQVTPARLDAKQAYQETADGMVTLQIADTQQPLEKITQSFDKLIIAPGEAIDKLVDTSHYGIQTARDRVLVARIDLAQLGLPSDKPIPFTKGVSAAGTGGSFYGFDVDGRALKFLPDATVHENVASDTELKQAVTPEEKDKAIDAAYARFGFAGMGITRQQLAEAMSFSTCIYTRPLHQEKALITPLSEKVTLIGLDSSGSARTIGGMGLLAANIATMHTDSVTLSNEDAYLKAFGNAVEAAGDAAGTELVNAAKSYSRWEHIRHNAKAQSMTTQGMHGGEKIAETPGKVIGH